MGFVKVAEQVIWIIGHASVVLMMEQFVVVVFFFVAGTAGSRLLVFSMILPLKVCDDALPP